MPADRSLEPRQSESACVCPDRHTRLANCPVHSAYARKVSTESASVRTLPVIERLCSDRFCARKGTYTVRGQCTNCGSEFALRLTKGHEKPGGFMGFECPTCGCRRVAGHELISTEDGGE